MKYNDIVWNCYRGAFVPKVHPHQDVVLSKEDAIKILKRSNAYFLRWTNKWDSNESPFWYVIQDKFFDINELSRNTRSKIRRGYKRCYIKKVDKKIIATEGYDVYHNAFKKYKTDLTAMNKESFYNNIMAKESYDFFAVYNNDTDMMIAYSTNYIDARVCNYTTIKFHPEYLKLYPSYVLFYEMSKYYLKENNYFYIHDGARSIAHDTNIHDFLLKTFKFRKSFVKLNLVYRWDVKIIINTLYPFRKIIEKIKNINKLNALLLQENIFRSYNEK